MAIVLTFLVDDGQQTFFKLIYNKNYKAESGAIFGQGFMYDKDFDNGTYFHARK